jgi:protein-S-isoprenylcysteine O-methyltransferase Ste14
MSFATKIFLTVFAPLLALSLAYLGLITIPLNSTGWFLVLMGLAYLIGLPVYLWKNKTEDLFGTSRAVKVEGQNKSFWLVQPGFVLAIYGAPLEYLLLPAVLPRLQMMQAAGWILLAASILLFIWARRALYGQFSGHLQVQEGHRLVTGGPYRLMRHPAYLGYLLMCLGVALGYSSVISLAALLLLLLPGLIYRICVEEKLLVDHFGSAYEEYARRTRRLFPGVW